MDLFNLHYAINNDNIQNRPVAIYAGGNGQITIQSLSIVCISLVCNAAQPVYLTGAIGYRSSKTVH